MHKSTQLFVFWTIANWHIVYPPQLDFLLHHTVPDMVVRLGATYWFRRYVQFRISGQSGTRACQYSSGRGITTLLGNSLEHAAPLVGAVVR